MPRHFEKDAEGDDDRSVLDFRARPGGLGEFEEELELVEPLFPATPPSAAEFPRDTQPPPPRRSWPAWALVAVVAVSGGAWLAVHRSQTAATSARPAVVVARDEPQVRAIADAAVSAVPLSLRQDPPRLDRPKPVEAAPDKPVEPAHEGARAAVNEALETYRRSFNTLDAAAVSAVWPGADRRALEQGFAGLRYQNLSLERCDVRLTGTERAVASCEASISSVLKAGDGAVQRRRGSSTIALEHVDDRWLIAGVVNR